jgi:hypothetical protein
VATTLDPDVLRTLDVLIAARHERLAAEARNARTPQEHDLVRAGGRYSRQAPEFTGLGGTDGVSSDTLPDHPEAA